MSYLLLDFYSVASFDETDSLLIHIVFRRNSSLQPTKAFLDLLYLSNLFTLIIVKDKRIALLIVLLLFTYSAIVDPTSCFSGFLKHRFLFESWQESDFTRMHHLYSTP